VPRRGGGEVVNALLGNTTPIAVLARVQHGGAAASGRITPLAVIAKDRSLLFPDVPTLGRRAPAPGSDRGSACSDRGARPIVEVSAEVDASWPTRRSATHVHHRAVGRHPSGSTCCPFIREGASWRSRWPGIGGAEVNSQSERRCDARSQNRNRVCCPSVGDNHEASTSPRRADGLGARRRRARNRTDARAGGLSDATYQIRIPAEPAASGYRRPHHGALAAGEGRPIW
jgi:hypothetical protein